MVARKQRRRVRREVRGRVRIANDLHAVFDHSLVGLRALHIAALCDSEVEDDATRLHRRDLSIRDQARRGPTRDQRGRDDDILLGDMFGDQLRLRGLVLVAHLGRVAARALAFYACHFLDKDRLRTQRLDLFLGGRTYIGRRDLRAEALGRRNRLQTRYAHTHDENAGSLNCASRRHHHRKCAAIFVRRGNHRLVACEVRLAGQHVHALCAGDARHEFHRQGFKPRLRVRIDQIAIAERIEQRRDPCPALGTCKAACIALFGDQRENDQRDDGNDRNTPFQQCDKSAIGLVCRFHVMRCHVSVSPV